MDTPEAAVLVLRFRSDEVTRDCCDLTRMRKRWGTATARRISHRLQQLEAMTTLADLKFLPFDSHEHDNGVIEVAVADHLSLLIERGPDTVEGEALMDTITINGLRSRPTRVQMS